jgi:hypothetical protein
MKVDRLAGRFITGLALGRVAPDDLGECCGAGSSDPAWWLQEDRSSGVQAGRSGRSVLKSTVQEGLALLWA